MTEFLDVARTAIITEIAKAEAEVIDIFGANWPWAKDVFPRIKASAEQGKLVRGLLVAIGAEAAGCKKISNDIWRVAAAMEILHTGILIHDDIIDEDLLRRGRPSVHAQYMQMAKKQKFTRPEHFGGSMGIVAGFLADYLASRLILRDKDQARAARVHAVMSMEMLALGLGQMQDVWGGYQPGAQTDSEIESVYIQKTGDYSFGLPVRLGWLMGQEKMDGKLSYKLISLSRALGIAFQLQDDILGVWGDARVTGKAAGSDIINRKDTWLLWFALNNLPKTEAKKLRILMQKNTTLSDSEVLQVKKWYEQAGVRAAVEAIVKENYQKAKDIIPTLTWPKSAEQKLQLILSMLENRVK